ncbi:hypothetical protein OROHE_005809 [Orobanche hederae]
METIISHCLVMSPKEFANAGNEGIMCFSVNMSMTYSGITSSALHRLTVMKMMVNESMIMMRLEV